MIKTDKIYKCEKQIYKDGKQSGCQFSIWRDSKPLGKILEDEDMKIFLSSSKENPIGNNNKIYLDLENKYFSSVIWENK